MEVDIDRVIADHTITVRDESTNNEEAYIRLSMSVEYDRVAIGVAEKMGVEPAKYIYTGIVLTEVWYKWI